jgi:hypothetical protein
MPCAKHPFISGEKKGKSQEEAEMKAMVSVDREVVEKQIEEQSQQILKARDSLHCILSPFQFRLPLCLGCILAVS